MPVPADTMGAIRPKYPVVQSKGKLIIKKENLTPLGISLDFIE